MYKGITVRPLIRSKVSRTVSQVWSDWDSYHLNRVQSLTSTLFRLYIYSTICVFMCVCMYVRVSDLICS